MNEFQYVGAELELFAEVHNWKSYWSRQLRPFIHGDVLEVGAGIGANTAYLAASPHGQWVCLEPDPQLVARMSANLAQTGNSPGYTAVIGTTASLATSPRFDTIIYIDVLEHIQDDREELKRAAALLRPGGRIVALSPAHQALYTPFDKAIGHFRRYNRASLRDITPAELRLERLFYLDSAGVLLSTANRMLLQQRMPTREQLRFWDRCVIPVSRILDRCLLYGIGKSIVGIWCLASSAAA